MIAQIAFVFADRDKLVIEPDRYRLAAAEREGDSSSPGLSSPEYK